MNLGRSEISIALCTSTLKRKQCPILKLRLVIRVSCNCLQAVHPATIKIYSPSDINSDMNLTDAHCFIKRLLLDIQHNLDYCFSHFNLYIVF